MSIYNILREVANTSSRKEKESILNNNKDNELLKRVVSVTYDPHVDFYIREFDKNYLNRPNERVSLDLAIDKILVNVIAARKVTGNEAKELVEYTWCCLDDDDKKVFEWIIKRDLRCGCSATTFNKVWKDLIYDPPYMRCSSFSVKNLSNIKFPCFSQLKADGLYCNVIVRDGVITYESRNGNITKFRLPEYVEKQILESCDNVVLHGEALALNDAGDIMNRQESNGYLNSDDVDANRVMMQCWDIVSIKEYNNKISKVPYEERFDNLQGVASHLCNTHFQVIDTKECYNINEVIEHFQEMSLAGMEGTVVKNKSAIWKDGTSKDQVKMKCEFDCDLVVVDVKKGTGRNEGLLGAIVCESSDGELQVSVGTGFKDTQRKQYNYDNIVGKVVTVKANDILTSAGNDTVSLFLPRFIEVRNDKNVADSLERVKQQRNSFFDTLKFN